MKPNILPFLVLETLLLLLPLFVLPTAPVIAETFKTDGCLFTISGSDVKSIQPIEVDDDLVMTLIDEQGAPEKDGNGATKFIVNDFDGLKSGLGVFPQLSFQSTGGKKLKIEAFDASPCALQAGPLFLFSQIAADGRLVMGNPQKIIDAVHQRVTEEGAEANNRKACIGSEEDKSWGNKERYTPAYAPFPFIVQGSKEGQNSEGIYTDLEVKELPRYRFKEEIVTLPKCACIDSDEAKGRNAILETGYAKGETGTSPNEYLSHVDYCTNDVEENEEGFFTKEFEGEFVVEGSCVEGSILIQKKTCPEGFSCAYGACVKSCMDSDEGKDAPQNAVKGTTIGYPEDGKEFISHYDYCVTSFGTRLGNGFVQKDGAILPHSAFQEMLKEGKHDEIWELLENAQSKQLFPNAVMEGGCIRKGPTGISYKKFVSIAPTLCKGKCGGGACFEGCTDSDGGLEYGEKGNTKGFTKAGEFKEHTDYCVQKKKGKNSFSERWVAKGTHVVEGFCAGKESSRIDFKLKECPTGCMAGKCVDPCKKISGDGPIKVVFVGADFGSKEEMVKAFEETVANGFGQYEPFKSRIDRFSFWYVDGMIPPGLIPDNLFKNDYDEKQFDEATNPVSNSIDRYAEPCGKFDMRIFLLPNGFGNVNGWAKIGENRIQSITDIPTILHEVGHGFCGLGHSFGGFYDEKRRLINCDFGRVDIPSLVPGNPLLCKKWDFINPPNCFMGCGTALSGKRQSFGSIMSYAVIPQFRPKNVILDYGRKRNPEKFNVQECIGCMKAMGFSDGKDFCNSLPVIVGSKKYSCKDDMDCIGVYGDCAGKCDISSGKCGFLSSGEKCEIAPNVLGYCGEHGVCNFDKEVECLRGPVCIIAKGYDSVCLKECSPDFRCIPEYEKTECSKTTLEGRLQFGMCGSGDNAGKCEIDPLADCNYASDCEKTKGWDAGCLDTCDENHKCVPSSDTESCYFTGAQGGVSVGICGKQGTPEAGKCQEKGWECAEYTYQCEKTKGWMPECIESCTNNKCKASPSSIACSYASGGRIIYGSCGEPGASDEGKCVDKGWECIKYAFECKDKGFDKACASCVNHKCNTLSEGTECGSYFTPGFGVGKCDAGGKCIEERSWECVQDKFEKCKRIYRWDEGCVAACDNAHRCVKKNAGQPCDILGEGTGKKSGICSEEGKCAVS